MKVRNIKVAIKSDEDILKEVKDVVGKIERGEKVKKHEGISFDSIDAIQQVSGIGPATYARIQDLITVDEAP